MKKLLFSIKVCLYITIHVAATEPDSRENLVKVSYFFILHDILMQFGIHVDRAKLYINIALLSC